MKLIEPGWIVVLIRVAESGDVGQTCWLRDVRKGRLIFLDRGDGHTPGDALGLFRAQVGPPLSENQTLQQLERFIIHEWNQVRLGYASMVHTPNPACIRQNTGEYTYQRFEAECIFTPFVREVADTLCVQWGMFGRTWQKYI